MLNPQAYCLGLLKRRLRSRFELDEAMRRKGVEPEDREKTLRELEEIGLVNDEHYALAWVHTRDALAPRGQALLRAELMQKGISKEIITKTLANRRDQVEETQLSEEELARQLVESRSRSYQRLDPETQKRRMMALLQRRGFSYEVIRRILKI